MTSKNAINKNNDDAPLIEITKTGQPLWKCIVDIIKGITVEPLGIVSLAVYFMYTLISKQYIYDYVAKSYGLNTSSQNSACANSSSIEDKVAAEASDWVLYLNIAGFVPSLFTTVIIGSWGDTVGRRLPFLIGFFGYLVMVTNFLIVLCFELPVYYLFIGRIVSSTCGDIAIILGCMFAYLADTSTKENRTVKVAVGESCIGIGGIVGSLLSAFWVDRQGYIPPFIFLVVIIIASMLYIKFVLKESIEINPMPMSRKIKLLFSKKPFIGIKKIFIDFDHILKIFGAVFCFFMQIIVVNGFNDVMVIYELSPPFCWNSVLVGYASAVKLLSLVVSLICIKVFNQYVSDYVFVVAGTLSNISCLLFYSFSTTTWMLFLGLVTGWLSSMLSTVARSVASKLVTPEGQGSIFALLAQAESVSGLVASFIFNPIYSATVAWFSGFVFVVMVIFVVTMLILFTFVYLKVKDDIKKD